MNRITFLDNAYKGQNNWWRYVLTTFLTWVVGFVLALLFMIFILIIIYLFNSEINIIQLVSDSTNTLFILTFLGVYSAISFLLFYICIRFIHHKKFIDLINTYSKINWMRLLKGAVLWFIILGVASILDFIIDPGSIKLSFNPNAFFTLLILCLIVFPIQASLEEVFFRGYLMQGFGILTKMPLVPLLTTSIIFSLLHFFNGADPLMGIVIVIQTFILGITLGIITLGENGLETAMGVHIAQNIFVVSIFSSSDSVFNNSSALLTLESEPSASIPFFVLILLLLAIIFWNKKGNLSRIFKTQEKIGHFKYLGSQNNRIKCFKCNTINLNEANYCRECGMRIEKYPTDKIYCLNCHILNPKEAVYCRHCGMQIKTPENIESKHVNNEMQCFNCYTINPDEAIYCKQCGTKISS